MVNGWMVLLWVTVVVLCFGILALVLFLVSQDVEESQSSTIASETLCSQLTSGLPEIGELGCCQNQGVVKYWFDLSMDLSPSEVSYQSICRQYCPSGFYDMVQDVCLTEDPVITSQVQKCVNSLKPVNCTGLAKPVAISYGTLYYGLRANLEGCNTVKCPQ